MTLLPLIPIPFSPGNRVIWQDYRDKMAPNGGQSTVGHLEKSRSSLGVVWLDPRTKDVQIELKCLSIYVTVLWGVFGTPGGGVHSLVVTVVVTDVSPARMSSAILP